MNDDNAVQEWLRSLEHAADGPELARQIEQVMDALLAHGMAEATAAEEQARAERYRRSAESGIARGLAAHGISSADPASRD